jgi:aspartate kinase
MTTVVQKYGGSSLADAERIEHVARRISSRRAAGDSMVVVVAAMGDTTDELIALARRITNSPAERELDVLLSTGEVVSSTLMAMALRQLGVEAVSLTGYQAGIQTDRSHSRARILSVEPQRIRREIDAGRAVIVAGFQGFTEDLDITTLGRGGSDTTAVALAAALGAARCEIYTDVEGIFSADPRIEPRARKLVDIGYDEMLEMASHGARVMHPRAVELGAVHGLPILVASSFSETEGTIIHGGPSMEATNKVRGVAHDNDVAKITVRGVPDRPGIAATLFEPLAGAGVSVDTIVQNSSLERLTDLTFTVTRADLERALQLVDAKVREIGAREVSHDRALGKVSIVGTGMQNTPGYASRMFRTLFDAGINIELITTSEIRITCIVAEDRVADAVRALHSAFALDRPEA